MSSSGRDDESAAPQGAFAVLADTGSASSLGGVQPLPDQARRDRPLKALPRRFYKEVACLPAPSHEFLLTLDGRVAKTPRRQVLSVPTAGLASVLAGEWAAQEQHINPARMPLTTLVTTALDAVSAQRSAVADEIARYAMSDLLCYRSEGPRTLVAQQAETWDPVLAWATSALGVSFVVTSGLMPVSQDAALRPAVQAMIGSVSALELAALHVVTTITGSALLALAYRAGQLSGDALWAAAHVDEDYQIALWGEDDEAKTRRARRHRDCAMACRVIDEMRAVTGSGGG